MAKSTYIFKISISLDPEDRAPCELAIWEPPDYTGQVLKTSFTGDDGRRLVSSLFADLGMQR